MDVHVADQGEIWRLVRIYSLKRRLGSREWQSTIRSGDVTMTEHGRATMSAFLNACGERPRLVRELVPVTMESGVLIEGLGRLDLIQGAFAQTVLPELLNLLDGTRTLQEICDAFPFVPSQNLESALNSLWEWGLMEHVEDQHHEPEVSPHTAAFAKRIIASLSTRQPVSDACRQLKSGRITVLAGGKSHAAASIVRNMLKATGVDDVVLRSDVPFPTRQRTFRDESSLHWMKVTHISTLPNMLHRETKWISHGSMRS